MNAALVHPEEQIITIPEIRVIQEHPQKRYYRELLEQHQEALKRTHCPDQQKDLKQIIRHCEYEMDLCY